MPGPCYSWLYLSCILPTCCSPPVFVQDTTIMAFGAASVVVNQLFITFARAEWLLYLGLLFGCHGWCTSTLCRSILSKVQGFHHAINTLILT